MNEIGLGLPNKLVCKARSEESAGQLIDSASELGDAWQVMESDLFCFSASNGFQFCLIRTGTPFVPLSSSPKPVVRRSIQHGYLNTVAEHEIEGLSSLRPCLD